MSEPTSNLRETAWHLALYLGTDRDHTMRDGTRVDLRHVPALLEARDYALERSRELRAGDLKCIADLRLRLKTAELERDAVTRELVTLLAVRDLVIKHEDQVDAAAKSPDKGVASFLGTLPGDETDAEFLDSLRDVSGET